MKSESGENKGHGHIYPRSDGVKVRCGGPALCSTCAAELAFKSVFEAKKIKDIGQDPETSTIALCALRYCMGRRTYIPSLVIDWTKRHWEELDPHVHVIVFSDLKQAFGRGVNMGDNCDLDTWRDFWEWVQRKMLETVEESDRP